jgi:uncharacterized membrane protein YbhN (UPF0104 family)
VRGWLAHPVVRRSLSIACSLAAFGYLFHVVDLAAVSAVMGQLPLRAWLSAAVLSAAALACGVWRWWLLFRAFGAPNQPSVGALARHYAVGFFYNTYLPGGVSGDLVRGLATQQAFGAGSAGGLATVVFERALGLSALLGLVVTATLAHAGLGLERFRATAAVAFGVGLFVVLALSLFGFVARALPAVLRHWFARLPTPQRVAPIFGAWVLSLGSQLAPALSGYILLSAIHGQVSLLDAVAIIPVASAAAFVPFSVSGAGIRETLFVELYSQVGVPAQASLAASLSLWATQACLAGVCGVYVLLGDSTRASRHTPERPATH